MAAGLVASNDDKNDASSQAYNEDQHPRGIDGTWVEKGGEVDYVDPVTGEVVRATIVGFDENGNAQLKFKDGRPNATIPKDSIGDTIKGAPKRMATLYQNPNEGGKLDDAKKKGGGGGGGGGGGKKPEDKKGGGGGGGTDKAAADKAKQDKADAAAKAKADKEAVAAQDKADRTAKADQKEATRAQEKSTREQAAADRRAAADQARADRKAATDAKEAQRVEDRKPVLPSDMEEGAKVQIDGKDGDWTVQAVKRAPNGTIVVDIVDKDGRIEQNYPISGPSGKRMTQGQLKIRPVK